MAPQSRERYMMAVGRKYLNMPQRGIHANGAAENGHNVYNPAITSSASLSKIGLVGLYDTGSSRDTLRTHLSHASFCMITS